MYVQTPREGAWFGIDTIRCVSNPAPCTIFVKKDYTPVIYGLEPPVVYFGSTTNLWFKPKKMASLISNLQEEQMPFINAKVGGALIDFDQSVTFDI